MPAERVLMRQAREIIRLKFSASIPTREIARRLGVATSTVRETLRRFESTGLGWPLPNGMSEATWRRRFTPITGPNGAIAGTPSRGLELRCGERKFTLRGLSHTWIYSERSPCRR